MLFAKLFEVMTADASGVPRFPVQVDLALLFGTTLLFGLVPTPGVSWQGHLFGALSGVLAARGGAVPLSAHSMTWWRATAIIAPTGYFVTGILQGSGL